MKLNINNLINRIGMAAIILVCLGDLIFGSSFAQLRLEFSFLNFPVFIGEILLAATLFLFIFKNVKQGWELGNWGWVLGAYLFFILFKAFSGYVVWGPIAFRDAALFYYPLFIVLGYSFWSQELESSATRRVLIAIILFIFVFHQFTAFGALTLLLLGIILVMQEEAINKRMILLGIILILAPYNVLFNVLCRAVFVSLLVAGVFLAVMSFLLFCKNRWLRIVGSVLGCLFLGLVCFKIIQTGMWKTIDVKGVRPLATVVPQTPSRAKCLFHPVGIQPDKPDAMKDFFKRMSYRPSVPKQVTTAPENNAFVLAMEKRKEIDRANENELKTKQGDSFFRFYIWRDMIFEYLYYRPFWGFDFGRPLCSWTMKHYGLPSTEDVDGWIGAHNSFLYMIYRAGILGAGMILLLLFSWFKLVCDFYALKDWTGLLFCAILLNWMVVAGFFMIFELPYTAIPVWTILGISLKHRVLLKKSKILK